jgi:hypothetical protein
VQQFFPATGRSRVIGRMPTVRADAAVHEVWEQITDYER